MWVVLSRIRISLDKRVNKLASGHALTERDYDLGEYFSYDKQKL